MRLLLDTHVFLWFVAGDARLSRRARRALEDEDNDIFLSAASVWEMAIKTSLGRLTLPTSVARYTEDKLRHGLQMLPIDWPHAAGVEDLPWHHSDPFDRLLIAQARIEGFSVVTGDAAFRPYGVTIVW